MQGDQFYGLPHLCLDRSDLLQTLQELRQEFAYDFLVDIFASHHPSPKPGPAPKSGGKSEPGSGAKSEPEVMSKTPAITPAHPETKNQPQGKSQPEEKEFRLHYHLCNMKKNQRLLLRLSLDRTDLIVPTVTTLYSAANWLERETYDFYGIVFEGHPDLRRILNMYEMTDFPLRKEFPLEDSTREDKPDKYFGR